MAYCVPPATLVRLEVAAGTSAATARRYPHGVARTRHQRCRLGPRIEIGLTQSRRGIARMGQVQPDGFADDAHLRLPPADAGHEAVLLQPQEGADGTADVVALRPRRPHVGP